MEVKVFIQDHCPACPGVVAACKDITCVTVYDVGEADGQAEACSWGVSGTPTVIVVDSGGQKVAFWQGETPDPAVLRSLLAN